MAKFIRKENGLKLEFGKVVFVIDVAETKLRDKLLKFGEMATDEERNKNLTLDQQKQELIDFYESLLGKGSYEKIKKEVFDGEDLKFEDLLDVGYFLIEETNKYNEMVISKSESRIKFNEITK